MVVQEAPNLRRRPEAGVELEWTGSPVALNPVPPATA